MDATTLSTLNAQLNVFHLSIDSYYHVLICSRCKFVIAPTPKIVLAHLKRYHQDTSLTRKIATSLLSSYELVSSKEALLKPNWSRSDKRLLLHDGLQCSVCSDFFLGRQAHRRHVKANHGDAEAYPIKFQTWCYLPFSGTSRWLVLTNEVRHVEPHVSQDFDLGFMEEGSSECRPIADLEDGFSPEAIQGDSRMNSGLLSSDSPTISCHILDDPNTVVSSPEIVEAEPDNAMTSTSTPDAADLERYDPNKSFTISDEDSEAAEHLEGSSMHMLEMFSPMPSRTNSVMSLEGLGSQASIRATADSPELATADFEVDDSQPDDVSHLEKDDSPERVDNGSDNAGRRSETIELESFDRFVLYKPFCLLICMECQTGVRRSHLQSHLRSHHRKNVSSHPSVRAQEVLYKFPDAGEMDVIPKQIFDPIPFIPISEDSIQCIREPDSCFYVCGTVTTMKAHRRRKHPDGITQGWQTAKERQRRSEQWNQFTRRVRSQQLFKMGPGSHFIHLLQLRPTPSVLVKPSPQDILADRILENLAAADAQTTARLVLEPKVKEISTWLNTTKWHHHLEGQDLLEISELAAQTDRDDGPTLAKICASVKRHVDRALNAIRAGEINPFDLALLHSARRYAHPTISQTHEIELQKPTWRKYIRFWQCLIAYVCRIQDYCRGNDTFKASLTLRQSTALKEAQLAATQQAREGDTELLDRKCLELFLALIDQRLDDGLYKSIVLSFLAVTGIDRVSGEFRPADQSTSILSGFIKINRMLVLRKSIMDVEDGTSKCIADSLGELRLRILTQDSRSPTAWILHLRTVGKQLRNTSTTQGHFVWSDDSNDLSYKEIRHFSMDALRHAVKDQQSRLQEQLSSLLLLDPEDELRDLKIHFDLEDVVDNASGSTPGYNFLSHPNNMLGPLPDGKKWLMSRVLGNDITRNRFLKPSSGKSRGDELPTWKRNAALAYEEEVEKFLESLLFLIHVTSGQPARATELMCLRHSNSQVSGLRNVFVENGNVSTVTRYHKGMSITGSIKLVHRFLPGQIGKMLVYYLWLVLPFRQQLDNLVLRLHERPSPYIWANKRKYNVTWDPDRLKKVLTTVFLQCSGQTVNVAAYRQIAIAIAREHLPDGTFKRGHTLKDTAIDLQAGHSSVTAGSVYGRGLEDGSGHLYHLKREYRKSSQDWHAFLGLLILPIDVLDQQRQGKGKKRMASDVESGRGSFPESDTESETEPETEFDPGSEAGSESGPETSGRVASRSNKRLKGVAWRSPLGGAI